MQGIILKTKNRKRVVYKLQKGNINLNTVLKELPNGKEDYRLISVDGGFSSINFINFVCQKTIVNNLFASTLRVGKVEIQTIDRLKKMGKVNNCTFCVGTIMKENKTNGIDYKYSDFFENICSNNNWDIHYCRNHSKVILFDTDCGKFVLETSSNLNENPKIEQYIFTKSDEIYDFYQDVFLGKEK
ncbi:MAG: hypothetical protein R3Y09_06745 [Clostridia bacterium]